MNNRPVDHTLQRIHVRVSGIVQGVGFRPFVYGLARRFALNGFVGNDNLGVFIEIEGDEANITGFIDALIGSPPPLAHIEAVQQTTIAPQGSTTFTIVESDLNSQQASAHTLVSPDLCICDDCLRELLDPANRRYRYPFTNCTNCGPRFTIIKDLPYDRPLTTLAGFPMCPDCQREYHDPLDRRFHAQPNACPVCGPSVWFSTGADQNDPQSICFDAGIVAAQQALAAGKIVAVKGLGGFHLACDATNDTVLTTLRTRKGRGEKPFAVMMRDLAIARQYAEINDAEARLLTSRERPIVLLRKKSAAPTNLKALSQWVAPGNAYIGIMLPYTPLHYVLIGDTPLVMTSGNLSGEPIVRDNNEAVQRLSSIADCFLLHNRPIQVRCDDSVIRVLNGHELPIRRSRGYAPFPVKLPVEMPSILAVGGELKATFCVTTGQHAILSQHIGDMENLETLASFEEAVAHLLKLFRIEPTAIACDLHPRYMSAQWAAQYAANHNLPLRKVQHHHAHIAALMAESGLIPGTQTLGFCFDGTGFGGDGTIWGGEVLLASYAGFSRLAYLKPIPLPGGDAAIKRPYRTALAHLWAAGCAWDDRLPCVAVTSTEERRILRRQFERSINTVQTSSMGRLFDAVAALAGVQQLASYEAQAAIEFESLADPVSSLADADLYRFDLLESESTIMIDPAPVLRAICADVLNAVTIGAISARFHGAVASMIVALSTRFRAQTGVQQIALSGGVFQNVRLLEDTLTRLNTAGFDVLHHRLVPPNDGGIALGQAIVAANTMQPSP
jgi:hydrogenase maturation protein HypF